MHHMKKVTKAIVCIVIGAGLIGFVKGLIVGYLVGSHKARHGWHSIKCTGETPEVKEE